MVKWGKKVWMEFLQGPIWHGDILWYTGKNNHFFVPLHKSIHQVNEECIVVSQVVWSILALYTQAFLYHSCLKSQSLGNNYPARSYRLPINTRHSMARVGNEIFIFSSSSFPLCHLFQSLFDEKTLAYKAWWVWQYKHNKSPVVD